MKASIIENALKKDMGGRQDHLHRMAWRAARGIREALTLVVVALLLSVFANGIRSDGLPWRGDWSPGARARVLLEGLNVISLEEAWRLFLEGKALFLDARDPATYMFGHLPGALNVQPEEAGAVLEDIRAMVSAGMVPIAYCDGTDCPLSPNLARALEELGISDVRILVNGWSAWKAAGYPVEGS